MEGGPTFGQDYASIYKFKENTSSAAAAVWTPTTSTRIVLTDIFVSNGAAPAGTFQIRFGNVGGAIVMNSAMLASSWVVMNFSSGVVNPTYDQALFFETNASQSTGGWTCTANGFEMT